jgi:hypothetical protein
VTYSVVTDDSPAPRRIALLRMALGAAMSCRSQSDRVPRAALPSYGREFATAIDMSILPGGFLH